MRVYGTTQEEALPLIISRTENVKGCWVWQKAINRDGYGITMIRSLSHKVLRVHRAVWFLVHGSWPGDLHHTCGNKACCNPDHLVEVTQREHSRLHYGDLCPGGHDPSFYREREKKGRYCRECDRLRVRARRRGPEAERIKALDAAARKKRRHSSPVS